MERERLLDIFIERVDNKDGEREMRKERWRERYR